MGWVLDVRDGSVASVEGARIRRVLDFFSTSHGARVRAGVWRDGCGAYDVTTSVLGWQGCARDGWIRRRMGVDV